MKEPVAPSTLAIEYVALDELLLWPGNPKEHDVGAIAASIERFGFRDPIAVNHRNGEIEEGHGRLKTLKAFKTQGRQPPAFIVEEDGQWLVPIMRFDDDDLTQQGYTLAHNRTQELGGGYDHAKLLVALERQASYGKLTGTGWDGDDIAVLRKKLAENSGAPDQTGVLHTSFQILITCENETQQIDLVERFQQEGLTIRVLTT
jgi:hypothetical protein